MEVPWYQKIARWVVYALIGFGVAGNILDNILNAISLIIPPITYWGTAAIIVCWGGAQLYLKNNPLPWSTKGRGRINLSHLGVQPTLALCGVILLFWIPRFVDLYKENQPESGGQANHDKATTVQQTLFKSLDNTNILIADFQAPQSSDQYHGVTDIIFDQLNELEKTYPDIEVQPLRETITAKDGSDLAHKKGKEHNASIVIWGFYHKTDAAIRVTVYFEVLKKEPYFHLRHNKQIVKAEASRLRGFKIQEQLSKEMRYLTLLTAGLAHYWVDNFDDAIDRFKAALKEPAIPKQMIDPAAIYLYLGTSYHYKDDIDNAIKNYNQAVNLNRNEYGAYNNRGIAHMMNNNYKKALIDFNRAISIKANEAAPYNNRGQVLIKQEKINDAIVNFDQALKLEPESASIYHINKGIAFYVAGEFDKAIEQYSKVTDNYKDNDLRSEHVSLAYFDRALIYKENKNYAQALDDLKNAIELKSDEVDFYSVRGEIYIETGEFQQALETLNRAVELIGAASNLPDETKAEVYSLRGRAHDDLDKHDLAIMNLELAIKLDRNCSDAYANLGRVYYHKGNYEQAIHHYKKSISLGGTDDELYNNIGLAYKTKGEIDKAMSSWAKAIKQGNIEAYLNRATIYFEKCELNKAIADVQKVLELSDDDQIRDIAESKLIAFRKLGCDKPLNSTFVYRLGPSTRIVEQ